MVASDRHHATSSLSAWAEAPVGGKRPVCGVQNHGRVVPEQSGKGRPWRSWISSRESMPRAWKIVA